MKKAKIILLPALLLTALPALAQSGKDFSVSGVLVDSLSREVQPFATVRLLSPAAGGKAVRVATTDVAGAFRLKVPAAGSYTLEAVILGKQPLRRAVTFTDAHRSLSLDTLLVTDLGTTLGAATVTAQKPLVRAEIDKISYSMADDPEAQTNSTLEMLRKVPMVTVDGEDNIKVNGNSSFVVYVNGKPNKMMTSNASTILKSYPASIIEKIEVITNPGAKYDAEGVAGVLNIITKTESKVSGYTATPGFRISNGGYSGNVFGMVQLGKFMFSANFGMGWRDSHKKAVSSTEREIFAEEVNHLFRSDSEGDDKGNFKFGSFEASYEFTEKDLLSVTAGLHSWRSNNLHEGWSRMFNADNEQVYAYRQHTRSKTRYTGTDLSADYQHTFKPEQNITFSYRYDISPSYVKNGIVYSDISDVPESLGLTDLQTDPDNRSVEHTAQVDFTTPIGKLHTLSTGVKYIYRINRSDNEEFSRPAGTDAAYTFDDVRSLRYRHRGDIAAAYAEYSLKVRSWALQAGSRYEYYRVRVSYPDGKRPSFTTDMGDWVPTLSLGYSFKPTMMLKAGYNLRLARPDISYLSPYEVRNSPEAVSYGNPDLGSTKAHNLSLDFSSFGPKFSVNAALTHTFSNNEVANYSFIREGVQHTTYGNFMHSKVTTLSGYINWTIVDGTTLFMNFSGNYCDYKSYRSGEHNSGFGGSLFGSLRQKLPWKLQLSFHGGGSLSSVNLQGKTPGFKFYAISLNRNFMKEDRLSVTIGAGNFIDPYMRFRSETLTGQFRSVSYNRVHAAHYTLGVTYRFGSLRAAVKKAGRSIENNDVRQQSSGNQGSQQGGGI